MGTIKDIYGMELTEAEGIKTWQKYTELYKKILMTEITTMVCDQSSGARYPGMRSKMGLRKHHYEQS